LILASLVLAGCFDDGNSGTSPTEDSPPTSNPPPANAAPKISMSSQTVLVGQSLKARPTASDPDGQTLAFSISNAPAWISFNKSTGEMSGTPKDADVGTYEKIKITVSDGQAQASVTFSVTVTQSTTGRASLSWQAPSERTDGTPLTDLAGFRIYYGKSSGDLRYVIEIQDPGARSWVVENLTPGTWFFAASAFDTQGVESSRSNAASKTIA